MTLVDRAEGAHPVGGQVFKLGTRGDAVVGVTLRRVVHIPADVANILFHIVLDFRVNNSTAKIRLFSYTAKNILQKTLQMSGKRLACSFFHSFLVAFCALLADTSCTQ